MKILLSTLISMFFFLGVSNFSQAQLTAAQLPKGANIEAAKKHVIRPQNITGIITEDNNRDDIVYAFVGIRYGLVPGLRTNRNEDAALILFNLRGCLKMRLKNFI